jgi:serine/threonine-protein kinase
MSEPSNTGVAAARWASPESDVDLYFRSLLEASSLGTPTVSQILWATPASVADDVRRRLTMVADGEQSADRAGTSVRRGTPARAGDWEAPGFVEERQLGNGASGRVVVAFAEATGKRVAIKYLSSALVSDPKFMWQFRTSVELQKSLDILRIVRVFDYVEAPGQGAAIVMELVNGVSLHEMIGRRGPAGPEAALAVLKGSLLGLAAAHAVGIVHRDYKPENVLVDADGNTKLTDFGVAVQAEKVPTAGTSLYMAPEQWHGAPSSPAADIYAATAVFFECLTGKAPFSGRPGQLRQQHESAAVPLNEVTDQGLRGLIDSGMAKNPADRPRDAISFVAKLETVAIETYGACWEERGREQLAARGAALLPLLFLGGDTAGSIGTLTETRWVGGDKRSRAVPARYMRLAVASVAVAAAVIVAGAVTAVALSGKNSREEQLVSDSSVAVTIVPTVQASVAPPVAASQCTVPSSFTYQGTITSTGPGPVSYRWVYSSGRQGPVQTVDFSAAGSLPVTGTTVNTLAIGTGWAEIQMLSPDKVTSNRASYGLVCGSKSTSLTHPSHGAARGA